MASDVLLRSSAKSKYGGIGSREKDDDLIRAFLASVEFSSIIDVMIHPLKVRYRFRNRST